MSRVSIFVKSRWISTQYPKFLAGQNDTRAIFLEGQNRVFQNFYSSKPGFTGQTRALDIFIPRKTNVFGVYLILSVCLCALYRILVILSRNLLFETLDILTHKRNYTHFEVKWKFIIERTKAKDLWLNVSPVTQWTNHA